MGLQSPPRSAPLPSRRAGAGAEREARGGCLSDLVVTEQGPPGEAGNVDYTFTRAAAMDPALEQAAPSQQVRRSTGASDPGRVH